MEGHDLDPTSTSNEPAPLRVIKRQSRRIRGSDATSEYGSTRSRRTSGQTEESIGSAPGLPGWDRPLTVRKKRQSVFTSSYSSSPPIRALRPERSYMMLPHTREQISSKIHSNGGMSSLKYPSPIKEMPDSVLPDGMDGYLSPAHHSSYDKNESVSQSPCPMEYSNAYHAPIYQDAHVLVPHISITPEARKWDNSGDVLWTAIEITGQVRQSSNSQPAFSQYVGCEGIALPDPFRYGLLFDIRINIQPLRGAFVTELLQDDPIPTTLYAGSTILILAHIRLKSQPASIASSMSASRQQSDDLMDDLEFHLDSSVRDHLSINLTYAHTAFPQHSRLSASFDRTGITSVHTRMGTTATASLKRPAHRSSWSSHPVLTPNPLFNIITANWPPDRAAHAINRMLTCRAARRCSDPRRQCSIQIGCLPDGRRSPSTPDELCDGRKTAPPVQMRIPRRETSLTNNAPGRRPEQTRVLSPNVRRSSREDTDGDAQLAGGEQDSSANAAWPSDLTLRNRASTAGNTVATSSPSAILASASSAGGYAENQSCRESAKGVRARKGGQTLARRGSERGRNDGGRWNWSNWW